MTDAEKKGYRGYVYGKPKNPYKKGSTEWYDFDAGFKEAAEDWRNNEISKDHIAFQD